MNIYLIDKVPTIITNIKNNIAKGFILNNDLTLKKCFIVKRNDLFSHGNTIRQAIVSINEKLFNNMSIDERIKMFLDEFKEDGKYPAMKFFEWHNKLTGSCEMGRQSFAQNKGIDLDNDHFTVAEFINITRNDFGGDVIQELEKQIENLR